MSVLDPRELQASPLADLHALAAELGLEGFRRLRKDDLIKEIVEAGGGTMPEPEAASEPDPEPEPEPAAAVPDSDSDSEPEALYEDAAVGPEEAEDAGDDGDAGSDRDEREEELRSGVLDVLPNGSGFIRAEPY